MAKQHKVKQGDCISSIAYKYGFFPDTIWNDSKNSKLKQDRKNPNVLYTGDEVFIPDKREKTENCATEQRHRFRKKGALAKLRVRIQRNNKPVSNAEYTLDIEDKLYKDKTGDDGLIEQSIPPDALEGKLTFHKANIEFNLQLGNLDPVEELSGVQARMKNLGFDPGPIDGKMGPRTRAALRDFQEFYELKETGQVDEETKKRMQDLHGA